MSLGVEHARGHAPGRHDAREQFAREMPDARVEVIPGAQHFIFLSHPERTEALMREFLLPPRVP